MKSREKRAHRAPVKISDHFTVGRLLRFTSASMAMMVFSSVYVVADGMFVSNFVGKTPFAALNLIYPFLQILGTVGFMLGAGGSALVSKTLGEGDERRANGIFSMLVCMAVVCGIALAVIGSVAMPFVASAFGAEGEMLDHCVTYGGILALGLPALLLQYAFQSLLVTAGRPNVGLAVTTAAGVANIALDALFILVFGWGLSGAAVATVLGQCVGGLVPLAYFARKNSSSLRLCRPFLDGRALLKACTNGSSELATNIAMSVVAMAYNYQLMRMIGEDGVAAYGVVSYAAFIVAAILIGYCMGVIPVIGFHFGARNNAELKGLLRRSLLIVGCANIVLTAAAFAFARPIAFLFAGYDQGLYDLTVYAFSLYSVSFILMGFNMFASAFFTALNNGVVSAVISFARTLVFETSCVLVLPALLGPDAIWFSIVVAEVLSLIVASSFVFGLRKTYGYW